MKEVEPKSPEQILRHKIDSVVTVLENIETPGFIENWPVNRIHRADKLSLQVSGMTKYQRLTGIVAPMRRRLRQEVLPRYQHELEILTQNQQSEQDTVTGVAPSEERKVALAPEVLRIAGIIMTNIPQEQISFVMGQGINERDYVKQVVDLATLAEGMAKGEIAPIDSLTIMNATNDSAKQQLVAERLGQTLARLFVETKDIPDREDKMKRMRYRWARQVRETVDFLGAGARDNFNQALDQMPAVERTLAVSLLSANMSESLGYVDIEECSPQRFATYIRHAAYTSDLPSRDTRLQTLVETAIERGEGGTLNIADVIEYLLKSASSSAVVKTMRESAKFLGFRDQLLVFFLAHSETQQVVRALEKEIHEGDEDDSMRPRGRRDA